MIPDRQGDATSVYENAKAVTCIRCRRSGGASDLLIRAALKLRTADAVALMYPSVAVALADLLERIYVAPRVAVMPSVREYAARVAREILDEESA